MDQEPAQAQDQEQKGKEVVPGDPVSGGHGLVEDRGSRIED
jgi:hypothetical protein